MEPSSGLRVPRSRAGHTIASTTSTSSASPISAGSTIIQPMPNAPPVARRGFHGASVEEVADVAGYTKGAVYSNFAGKDDLFLAVLESRQRGWSSSSKASPRAPPLRARRR